MLLGSKPDRVSGRLQLVFFLVPIPDDYDSGREKALWHWCHHQLSKKYHQEERKLGNA